MPVLSRLTALLLLAGSLALAGCYREVSDESARQLPRYTGNDPWTLDGLRPGVTFAEVTAQLGEPRRVVESSGTRTGEWNYGQTMVTFGRDGRAFELFGSAIKAGDRTLVSVGAPETELVQVLGEGATTKARRPKGSGVIALGSEHTHTLHVYENAGVRFEVSVQFPAATVANIWIRPAPAKR